MTQNSNSTTREYDESGKLIAFGFGVTFSVRERPYKHCQRAYRLFLDDDNQCDLFMARDDAAAIAFVSRLYHGPWELCEQNTEYRTVATA